MNLGYVPVADLTSREAMIARQKEIRRRQEEAARRLEASRPKPVHIEIPEPAQSAEPRDEGGEIRSIIRAALPSEFFDRNPRCIINRVAADHGVTYDDIVGPGRSALIVRARFEAIAAVAKANPRFNAPQIGRIFGGRNHTTILNALSQSNEGEDDTESCANDPATSPARIIQQIAKTFHVRSRNITGRSRRIIHIRARWAAIWAVHKAHPHLTNNELGEIFSKDRTSILGALCKMQGEGPPQPPCAPSQNGEAA